MPSAGADGIIIAKIKSVLQMIPYAGITRIKFKGYRLLARSQPIPSAPQYSLFLSIIMPTSMIVKKESRIFTFGDKFFRTSPCIFMVNVILYYGS